MNVLSLFNGISCGRLALERAGVKVDRYVSYEIDKYANTVAQKNYPDDEYCGDVTTADFLQYKGFDLVIGGSPCTYWSIAKTNREVTPDGFGGQLFMHFVRAVKETECRYFLYENNYSIHKDIKAFISEQLGVEPIMINSALVSAQQRKRCYWTNIPNVVQPTDRGILLKDILCYPIRYSRKTGVSEAKNKGISCLASDWRGINRNQTQNAVIEPVGTTKEKSYCLTATYDRAIPKNPIARNERTMIAEPISVAQRGRYKNSGNRFAKSDGGTEQYCEARQDNKSNCLTSVQKDSMVAEPVIFSRPHGFNRGGIKVGKCPTITSTGSCVHNNHLIDVYAIPVTFDGDIPTEAKSLADGKIYPVYKVENGLIEIKEKTYPIKLKDGYYIIRKLTPVECERLQTLPDNYTEGVSNTQRYKCIGNGWTVEVIAHILSYINKSNSAVKYIQMSLFNLIKR